MLTVLIVMVLGVAIGYQVDPHDSWVLFLGFFFGFVAGLITAFCIGALWQKNSLVASRTLVSLRGATQTTGDFFLGCGSVQGTPHYLYYVELDNGGYGLRTKRANAKNVNVYEEDRADGHLEVLKEQSGSLWWGFWDGDYTYNFRIPKGSIRRDFAL